MVGDLDKRKKVNDLLLAEHGIFVQPIKHPTVPRGTGGRRITPTAYHDDSLIDALARALLDVWASWISTATPRARGGVLRENSRETSMRRASLGRQVGRTLFTQQASIFAVRPIARTGCCQLPQH
jgi:hypothetical protein